MYFLALFPRGLQVDLEGTSTFSILMLSILHRWIKLGLLLVVLFIHLFTMLKGSWIGAAAFHMEIMKGHVVCLVVYQ